MSQPSSQIQPKKNQQLKLSDYYKKGNSTTKPSTPNKPTSPSISPGESETRQINQRIENNRKAISNPTPNEFKKPTPRQGNITIVCGETGVGKSYGVIREIFACLKSDPAKGKVGRPVFILDSSLEPEYKELFPNKATIDQVPHLKEAKCYRIEPLHPDGTSMNHGEVSDLCVKLCRTQLFNGTAVLDDYDNYASGPAKSREMTAIFISNRHRGQDIIIVHQSLGMISPIEMRNATLFRLHKCVTSVDTIRDRIVNYPLMKIAELIIWEQYHLAEKMYGLGQITEPEYRKRRSFFLYINIRTSKIVGQISKECFVRNCKKFIKLNKNIIDNYINMELDGDKNAMSRDEIMEAVIEEQFMTFMPVNKPM